MVKLIIRLRWGGSSKLRTQPFLRPNPLLLRRRQASYLLVWFLRHLAGDLIFQKGCKKILKLHNQGNPKKRTRTINNPKRKILKPFQTKNPNKVKKSISPSRKKKRRPKKTTLLSWHPNPRKESSKNPNGWLRRRSLFSLLTMSNTRRRSSTSSKAETQPPTMKTCTQVRSIGKRLPMQTEGRQLKLSNLFFQARMTSATNMYLRREGWLSSVRIRQRKWNFQA